MKTSDLRRLDAKALALIGHDVAWISAAERSRPTPCEGWTVADLVAHMNERHEAVITTVLPELDDPDDDPQADFARIAARWVVAMEQTGDVVRLPTFGPTALDDLLAIHLVDMLVHRWDLTRALRKPYLVPEGLVETALPLARSFTEAGSRLNGPGGVYSARLAEGSSRPAIDNLAALLGRDPGWSPPGRS